VGHRAARGLRSGASDPEPGPRRGRERLPAGPPRGAVRPRRRSAGALLPRRAGRALPGGAAPPRGGRDPRQDDHRVAPRLPPRGGGPGAGFPHRGRAPRLRAERAPRRRRRLRRRGRRVRLGLLREAPEALAVPRRRRDPHLRRARPRGHLPGGGVLPGGLSGVDRPTPGGRSARGVGRLGGGSRAGRRGALPRGVLRPRGRRRGRRGAGVGRRAPRASWRRHPLRAVRRRERDPHRLQPAERQAQRPQRAGGARPGGGGGGRAPRRSAERPPDLSGRATAPGTLGHRRRRPGLRRLRTPSERRRADPGRPGAGATPRAACTPSSSRGARPPRGAFIKPATWPP
jgi:hypothetical protein